MNILTYLFFFALAFAYIPVFRFHIVELPLLLCILAIIVHKDNIFRYERIVKLDIIVLLYAFFSLTSVVLDTNAFYDAASYYRRFILTPVLVYAVVRFLPVKYETLLKGLYAFSIGSLIQAIIYLGNYIAFGQRPHDVKGAITSTVTLSLMFICACSIFYYTGPVIKSKLMKKVRIVAIPILFSGLIATATRAAVVGFILFAPFSKIIWNNIKFRKVFSNIFISSLVVLMVIIFTTSFAIKPIKMEREKQREIQHSTERLISIDLYLKDLGDRFEVWRKACKLAMEHPVFGLGSASYNVQKHLDFFLNSTHNSFVSTLVVSGIPGLLLFISLVVATYNCLKSIKGKSKLVVGLGNTILTSFTVSVLVFTTNDLTGGRAFLLFFLMALAARLSILEEDSSYQFK